MIRRHHCVASALLVAAFGLSACGADEAPWPEHPDGLTPIDATAAETVIDTIMVGTRAASMESGRSQQTEVLDRGTLDARQVISAYEHQLDADWEELATPAGSIGRGWQHDDQRFVVMIVDVEDVPVVITIRSGPAD